MSRSADGTLGCMVADRVRAWRVYDVPGPADGARVLVDRRWSPGLGDLA